MQEHLRYRERFNYESVRFIVWFILIAGAVLFSIRVGEAVAARDALIMMPISIVMTLSIVAFWLFRAGRLESAMIVLLAGSGITMLAASIVFSFTA